MATEERKPHRGFASRRGSDRFVVGLGNPGPEYSETRHNAGYRVIEKLWKRHSDSTPRRRLGMEYLTALKDDCKVFIGRPLSFMNESGRPVSSFIRYFKGSIENLLVIHDDLDLPPGMMRFRRNGSSAGHRGVESIIEWVGSNDFHRLKVGIGRPGGGSRDVVDFVLGSPSPEEAASLSRAEERAAEAAWVWVSKGIDFCMNRFNRRAVGTEEAER